MNYLFRLLLVILIPLNIGCDISDPQPVNIESQKGLELKLDLPSTTYPFKQPKKDKHIVERNSFPIKFTLVNHSKQIQKFTTYTCSISASFKVDHEAVAVEKELCTKNGWGETSLKSKETYSGSISIKLSETWKDDKINFRIGFIKSEKEIIWSSPIELAVNLAA